MVSVVTLSQQWSSALYFSTDIANVTPTIRTGSPVKQFNKQKLRVVLLWQQKRSTSVEQWLCSVHWIQYLDCLVLLVYLVWRGRESWEHLNIKSLWCLFTYCSQLIVWHNTKSQVDLGKWTVAAADCFCFFTGSKLEYSLTSHYIIRAATNTYFYDSSVDSL